MATLQDQGICYRGEDYVMTFTMTPLTNILAWTISWRAKTTTEDPTALLTVNATVLVNGVFVVTLTAAQTATLTLPSYECDAWRTDSGSAALLARGRLLVNGSIRIR